MKQALFGLVLLSAVASIATPAAADCTDTLYGSVRTDYLLQDIRVNAGVPVSQNGATHRCGSHSIDLWTSVGLSGEGQYGNRGVQDEWNFTYTYGDTYDTPLGPLNVEGSISYWLLADFGETDDDLIGSYVQVGRPISIGSATVTPYVRFTQWTSMGVIEDQTLARPGIGVTVPFGDRFSFGGDLSQTNNLTMDDSHLRADATITYSPNDTTSFWVGGKFAEDAEPSLGIGFTHTLQ